jgi:hypothetical protein
MNMGRIKKNVKVAMRAIVDYGYGFLHDDMGADWNDEDFHTELGFSRYELNEAIHRLLKKLPKEE